MMSIGIRNGAASSATKILSKVSGRKASKALTAALPTAPHTTNRRRSRHHSFDRGTKVSRKVKHLDSSVAIRQVKSRGCDDRDGLSSVWIDRALTICASVGGFQGE